MLKQMFVKNKVAAEIWPSCPQRKRPASGGAHGKRGVSGPASGGVPVSAIQFGPYHIRTVIEELDLAQRHFQQRMPVMSRTPGVAQTRKFLCPMGSAEHAAILYEFESREARTREFEVPHEFMVIDAPRRIELAANEFRRYHCRIENAR